MYNSEKNQQKLETTPQECRNGKHEVGLGIAGTGDLSAIDLCLCLLGCLWINFLFFHWVTSPLWDSKVNSCLNYTFYCSHHHTVANSHNILHQIKKPWDLPGGPVVKNLPAGAGDTGLIPGLGTKIPHAMGQLGLCVRTTEAHVP